MLVSCTAGVEKSEHLDTGQDGPDVAEQHDRKLDKYVQNRKGDRSCLHAVSGDAARRPVVCLFHMYL